MTRVIIAFALLATVLGGCASNSRTPIANSSHDVRAEISALGDRLRKFEEPSQFFEVSAEKPAKVVGKHGTIISIVPGDLTTENGKQIGEKILVELKELTDQSALLRANAQTVSNGKLLVSGGAYYINLTTDGQNLKLKEGKTLAASFPKLTDKEMSLFYGQRDSTGALNWQQAQQRFVSSPSTVSKERKGSDTSMSDLDAIFEYIDGESKRPLTQQEKDAIKQEQERSKLERKLYATIQLSQLGWINCDRFLDEPYRTDLKYSFDERDSVSSTIVYLVFKDLNSIMQNYSSFYGYGKEEKVFKNIPLSARARLIAISLKDGKMYGCKIDTTITPEIALKVNWRMINDNELTAFFTIE